MAHLLVVEDELELQQLLVTNLEYEGFSVEVADDGVPALAAHARRRADLILLDLMLPRLDGFKVLEELRKANDDVPVLMLTARGAEADRVKGLSLGADDYLVKPFSVLELVARIRAILRRTRQAEPPKVLTSGPYRFDFAAMTATRDGRNLELTSREMRILEILVTYPGRTHSRSDLLRLAWEADARPSPRTVDVHVANLRKKLGDDDKNRHIATVGGEGYRWTG
ncbi:response regulator transcription factor [Mesoterricola silvestris]|uniref:DNA-binding response regulator n=1 Tax=Mesoterricola silvestris TaxID=2927979 RepID=A0AA48H6B3_9BACT|nr:response regulator transcription factor [Mesoterricola silvestris]BDU72648.1 DNA-binding response regulator [Mesoterricola silvestris]